MRTSPATTATGVVGWAGLATVLMSFFVLSEAQDFPGWVVLLPTGGTLAVLYAIADSGTAAARLLARPLPVLVGKLSYSLYLWHWPAIVLGRTWCELNGYPPEWGTRLGAGGGVVLAALAYRAIERPLRQRGPGRRRRLLVLATGFAGCAAATLLLSRWHPAIDAAAWFDPLHNEARLYDSARIGAGGARAEGTKYADVLVPPVPRRAVEAWKSGGIVHDWGHGRPRVVVLGSSHALMYGSLLDGICRELDLPVAFLSAQASRVYFDLDKSTAAFDAARRRWLREWHPDLVIVIDRWDWGKDARAPGGFEPLLRRLLAELEPHSRRVLLFTQVPVLRLGEKVNLREFVLWRRRLTGSFPTLAPDLHEPIRRAMVATMEALAQTDPQLRILRADRPFYLPDGSVRYASGRDFYYLDDDHLTTAGAGVLRQEITQAIQEALGK